MTPCQHCCSPPQPVLQLGYPQGVPTLHPQYCQVHEGSQTDCWEYCKAPETSLNSRGDERDLTPQEDSAQTVPIW